MWVCRFDPATKKQLAQMWRPWSEFSSVYGVVRYEFVSTRPNCKPSLLHWHLNVVWGKMLSKRSRRVESEGFISPPCRCTCSLCFYVCEKVIPHPPNFRTFSIVWVLSFSKTKDGVTAKEIQWYQHYSSKILGHLLGFDHWTSQNALNAGAVTGLTV
jgi:hypothetical protein